MAYLDVERDHEKTEEAIKTAISALETIDRITAERDAAIKDELLECLARIHRALEMSKRDSCGNHYEKLDILMSAIREIQDALIIYGDCVERKE